MGIKYQVGGSLRIDDPTYVCRQADEQLYTSLKAGEFCYVLDSRQMGKSSLLQRTIARLQQEDYACVYLDVTQLGSEDTTSSQWYGGVITVLWHQLQLTEQINLKQWWVEQANSSPLLQLHHFVEYALLKVPHKGIFIFIDEIDSLLGLDFSTDDFFAWIRHCYQHRHRHLTFNRLGVALFGVATPSDLIADKRRTPFNIGTAIVLHGFQLHEAMPLLQGLEGYVDQPQTILQEILYWTNGQPFLTQKLCQLVLQAAWDLPGRKLNLIPGTEADWIGQLVHSRIIQHWKTQDEPEHLRTIHDRLLFNEQCAARLLGLYQQILQAEEARDNGEDPSLLSSLSLAIDDSREQIELLLSGIVEKHRGYLRIKNPIYRHVFNMEWTLRQLNSLRPYAQSLNIWVASGYKDESRLLRGQALREALDWTQHKSLSSLDYKFLAASQELERQAIQQKLEAERLKQTEVQLAFKRKSLRRQRLLLVGISLALMIATILGFMTFCAYREAAFSEVMAIASASRGSFNANQHLDALVQAIDARQKLQRLKALPWENVAAVDLQTYKALEQAIYGADEVNRLSGHQGIVVGLAYSPDGKWIATVSYDRTIKIWQQDGTLVKTIPCESSIQQIQFSPDSHQIVAASIDGTVRLLGIDGKLNRLLKGHQAAVWRVAFSPDGQTIASGSADNTVKLWQLDGTLIRTIQHDQAVWALAFSPDGQTLATGIVDSRYYLWNLDGTLMNSFSGSSNGAPTWQLIFSPDSQTLLSGGTDGIVRLWDRQGNLLRRFEGHTAEIHSLAFSPDGQTIASGSADKTIMLWSLDGRLLRTFRGHRGSVRGVAFSPNGEKLVSASDDNTAKIWYVNPPLMKQLVGHRQFIRRIAFSPDGRLLASVSGDEIKFWHRNGTLIKTLRQEDSTLLSLAFSPDAQTLAVVGSRADIQLWQSDSKANPGDYSQRTLLRTSGSGILAVTYTPDGQSIITGGVHPSLNLWRRNSSGQFQLQQSLLAHKTRIWDVAVSPNGKWIASASGDGTVKLWTFTALNRLLTAPRTLNASLSEVFGVAFSPDSQWIATAGGDDRLRLWKTDGTLIRTIETEGIGLARLAFSPDGQLLAAAGFDNTVKLWRLDGTSLATLHGHASSVSSVVFSSDGKTLASSGDDQTIILWNLESILRLNLLGYSCDWIRDYLKTDYQASKEHICERRSGESGFR